MKKNESEEKEEINEGVAEEQDVNIRGDENETEQSPLEELQAKYDELNDRFLRLYSEFDNFRKRTQKEKLELYKTAGEDIILALLPVLDDFERAEKSMKDAQDPSGVKKGIDLIYQKLINILKQKGLKPMESQIGKKFDLETQEAITNIKAPEEKMKGKVIDEVERGYLLNDKVIRFSKVVVGE